MNEQNLNQFLDTTRQYLFAQAPAQNLIPADNSVLVQ